MDFQFFEDQDYRHKDGLRIKNAKIEHIVEYEYCGYITISYRDWDSHLEKEVEQILALNIGPQTILLNQQKQQIPFSDFQVGDMLEVLLLKPCDTNSIMHANTLMIMEQSI